MEARLTQTEIDLIRQLSKEFPKGHFITNPETRLDLPDDEGERHALLATMESMGFIRDVTHSTGFMFCAFQISPTVLQAARAIDEKLSEKKEPEDIVEQIKDKAKSKPVLAWGIILFGIITLAMAFVNQLVTMLQNFGVIAK